MRTIKQLLSSKPFLNDAFIIVRIIAAIMIARYGLEVFRKDQMDGIAAWLKDLHFPLPFFMAYLGKGVEFIGGICLGLGLLTRFACILLIIDMLVITFIMGAGNIFGDEQLPFLLMTLFICFLVKGGERLSLDHLFFGERSED